MSTRSQTVATTALFFGAALLVVIGALLLFPAPKPGVEPKPTPAPLTTGDPHTPVPTTGGTGGSTVAAPNPPAAPATSAAAQETTEHLLSVPAPVEQVARQFVTAWASHDARPGRDTSYEDAGRRAAAFASPTLGDDLAAARPATGGLWEQLRGQQAQVVAEVVEVRLPDGAPAPTDEVTVLRVIYRVTRTAVGAAPSVSVEQAALEVKAGIDGTWRVTALPNA
ncbi:hypothetical protein ACFRMQ_21285 [Kitasatospora sp. NPDC056783]|uniref:hypothetical protein n=1 Tax=Kitasatospora sp. NPDC056783 TaxID=3345943 RepID=UPI00368F223A